MTYRVNTIYPCIQGEGALTGTPMFMVRLQGCGVGCSWCDTQETWTTSVSYRVQDFEQARLTPAAWVEATAVEIAREVQRLNQGLLVGWVLVSGGEPADQNLAELVLAFKTLGFRVALETSGTALGHVGVPFDHVTVSPKIGMPGGKTVLPEAVQEAHEIKFPVGREKDVATLKGFLAAYGIADTVRVSVQPLSESARATALCVRECLLNGWHLSVQVHKVIGVP